MLFARRLSQLVVEEVLVDGIHQFSPDFDRRFMTLPPCSLFSLPLSAPGTSYIRNLASVPPAMGREVIR